MYGLPFSSLAEDVALDTTTSQSSKATFCLPCNIHFATPEQRAFHIATSNMHPYCAPCSRRFVGADALNNHIRESSQHQYRVLQIQQEYERRYLEVLQRAVGARDFFDEHILLTRSGFS